MALIEFDKIDGPSYEDSLNRGRGAVNSNSSLADSFNQEQRQAYGNYGRSYGYNQASSGQGQYGNSDSALANLYKNQDARAERSSNAFNTTRYINTALSGVGLIGQIFDNIGKQKIRDSQLKSLNQNRELAKTEYDHLVNYRNKLTTNSKKAFQHIFNSKKKVPPSTPKSTEPTISFRRGI